MSWSRLSLLSLMLLSTPALADVAPSGCRCDASSGAVGLLPLAIITFLALRRR